MLSIQAACVQSVPPDCALLHTHSSPPLACSPALLAFLSHQSLRPVTMSLSAARECLLLLEAALAISSSNVCPCPSWHACRGGQQQEGTLRAHSCWLTANSSAGGSIAGQLPTASMTAGRVWLTGALSWARRCAQLQPVVFCPVLLGTKTERGGTCGGASYGQKRTYVASGAHLSSERLTYSSSG